MAGMNVWLALASVEEPAGLGGELGLVAGRPLGSAPAPEPRGR
ncbi:hypothetical protein ACIA6D_39450 [Streptomyces cacaoi]